MAKKKIVIIGSSIAGASLAYFLARHAEVTVYEQKPQEMLGEKACANIVTPSFLKYAKHFGLNPWQFIVSKFQKANFFSLNNQLSWKTNEFKIDREKFLDKLISRAEKKGAEFNFNCEFINYTLEGDKFVVILEKDNKKFVENADILVGADGALSRVAKQADLWKNRKFFLVMQTEIPLKNLKNLHLEKNAYSIYLGKMFGYYGYIFPFKNKAIMGVGDRIDKAKKYFSNMLKFFKVKSGRIQAALVPEPKVITSKKNLFLIGDASCNVKFSAGGIIPAIMEAEALKELIINDDLRKIKKLRKGIFLNKLVTKAILKSKDKDFDNLLQIFKDKKFSEILKNRDEFGKSDYLKALDVRFLKFMSKLV